MSDNSTYPHDLQTDLTVAEMYAQLTPENQIKIQEAIARAIADRSSHPPLPYHQG
jgi:hypothetical protein